MSVRLLDDMVIVVAVYKLTDVNRKARTNNPMLGSSRRSFVNSAKEICF